MELVSSSRYIVRRIKQLFSWQLRCGEDGHYNEETLQIVNV